MFPVLETERLILREITKNDAEAVFACFSNEDVMRFYGQATLERVEQAEQMIEFFKKVMVKNEGFDGGLKGREQKA